MPYTTQVEHDGCLYTVTIPDLEVPRCEKCGTLVRVDAANRRVSEALRRQLGLLTPEEIRQNRDTLGLTQEQFADQLGVAEATLSRWETGAQIQQRALDNLLRLFFALPEVRSFLGNGRTGTGPTECLQDGAEVSTAAEEPGWQRSPANSGLAPLGQDCPPH
jgi:putative zinc finger/helix-turn-helix YgiT family protein